MGKYRCQVKRGFEMGVRVCEKKKVNYTVEHEKNKREGELVVRTNNVKYSIQSATKIRG